MESGSPFPPMRPAANRAIVIEEACAGSGIREAIAWELRQLRPELMLFGMDLGSGFVTHGDLASLYLQHGLDAHSIADHIWEVVHREN